MIGDAIFSEVGHNEAMILIGAVHDPLEHIPIGLLYMSVWDCPWACVLKFDRRLSLLS